MKNKTSSAIVLGATGLCGRILTQKLLQDDRYSKVRIFTRRASNLSHPKLEEISADLLSLEQHADKFFADAVFCCVGTTRKKTPDLNLYRQIDLGIPVTAAKLCRKNNISTLVVISSLGANAKSLFFYNRTKGEMEKEVFKQNVPRTFILRPSAIVGEREEKRFAEALFVRGLKFLGMFLPKSLRSYISADTIAQAMIHIAQEDFPPKFVSKEKIFSSEEIEKAASSKTA